LAERARAQARSVSQMQENPAHPCTNDRNESWVEFIWRKLGISNTRKKP